VLSGRLVADGDEKEREASEEEHDTVHEAFDEITQHLRWSEGRLGSRLTPIFGHVYNSAGSRRVVGCVKLNFRVRWLELFWAEAHLRQTIF